jgi:putative DNA primase/helicase
VRAAIDEAKPATLSETDDAARSTGPDFLSRRFKMLENGLHFRNEDSLRWISAPFSVQSETRDEAGNWGLQLTWRNRDGEAQSEVFGRELLAGDCKDVRLRLAAGGLTQAGDSWARQKLAEYLNLVKSNRRARCVQATGWHVVRDRRVFVLPEMVIGEADEAVILQSAGRDRAPFNRKGTLQSWRDSIGKFSTCNSRLVFAISIAFAGPLLDLVGEDGGGWNLKGPSRVGKTTALRVAASVWGGDALQGAAAFIRSWRATSNGLESVAAQFSDTLLPIDEMGSVEAKEIGDIAYMLANGSGKSRAGRDGSARSPARWRLLFLSTGEVGLEAKNLEARLNTKAGQQIRLIDVQADAGVGLGLYDELHGDVSADRFAEALRQGCRENFGTAGIAWLEWIVEKTEHDPEFSSKLREKIEVFVARWLHDFPDASGQVRSVARRYALVAMAGEMASQAGITGWPKDEAGNALRVMFESWLADRGTTGASEDLQARRQLSEFISRHGAGRFELWQKSTVRKDDDGTLIRDDAPVVERNKTLNSAGWRRLEEKDECKVFSYYLTDVGMKDALQGLDFRPAIKALCDAGMIVRDNAGKSKVSCEPPGVGKSIRLYLVPSFVVGGEDIPAE